MAGIYVHIPFCSSKCHYCNFYSTVSLKYSGVFIECLKKEIEITAGYLDGEIVETIYFGGGTPTTYSPDVLEEIINKIKEYHAVSPDVELTLEANPDDLSDSYLIQLSKTSFNRLSIGTQAFDDQILSNLNRRHSAIQSISAIENSKQFGFSNLSVDLIYGIPGLTNERWIESLRKVLAMSPKHISAYHLTVEDGTALNKMISQEKYPAVDDEIGMQQFDLMVEIMQVNGFQHYEISNFAIEGFRSRHNSNYWNGKKYLGLGPSAHSYNHISRQWNVSNLKKYVDSLTKGDLDFQREVLTGKDIYNEFVMLGFRTMEGLSIDDIKLRFGDDKVLRFKNIATQFIEKGLIVTDSGTYKLTKEGKKLADGIAANFFED